MRLHRVDGVLVGVIGAFRFVFLFMGFVRV